MIPLASPAVPSAPAVPGSNLSSFWASDRGQAWTSDVGHTVLRNPPPEPRRNSWPGIAVGALCGTGLALAVLVLASLLPLW